MAQAHRRTSGSSGQCNRSRTVSCYRVENLASSESREDEEEEEEGNLRKRRRNCLKQVNTKKKKKVSNLCYDLRELIIYTT